MAKVNALPVPTPFVSVSFRAATVPLSGCCAIPQGDAPHSALRPKGVSVLRPQGGAFQGEL